MIEFGIKNPSAAIIDPLVIFRSVIELLINELNKL